MTIIHPLARAYLKFMQPYDVVCNFKYHFTEKINTSSYFEEYSHYPVIENRFVKQKYIRYINSVKSPVSILTEDNILFTSGASEGLNLVMQAFCEPLNDHICLTTPSFHLYRELASRNQIKVSTTPLLGKFFDSLNIKILTNSKAKAIFLCSPNNPVGTELKYNQIKCLLANLPNTLVIIDETYVDFALNQNWLSLINDFENVIFIRSFSKAWALAGVRAGVVIANKSIIDTLKLIQIPFSFSIPAQENLLKRLDQLDGINKVINKTIDLRTKLFNFLGDLEGVQKLYPSSTNFVTVCLKHHDFYLNLFNQKNILAVSFNETIPNAIRLSIYDEKHVEKIISTISSHNK